MFLTHFHGLSCPFSRDHKVMALHFSIASRSLEKVDERLWCTGHGNVTCNVNQSEESWKLNPTSCKQVQTSSKITWTPKMGLVNDVLCISLMACFLAEVQMSRLQELTVVPRWTWFRFLIHCKLIGPDGSWDMTTPAETMLRVQDIYWRIQAFMNRDRLVVVASGHCKGIPQLVISTLSCSYQHTRVQDGIELQALWEKDRCTWPLPTRERIQEGSLELGSQDL